MRFCPPVDFTLYQFYSLSALLTHSSSLCRCCCAGTLLKIFTFVSSDIFSLSSFRTPDDGVNRAFTHTLSLSRSSRRKRTARTKKKKKKTNNQRKRSKRKTKRRRKRRETLIRIRKTQTSSTIYPATKSTLRSSFPVAGPLDRPGRCLRSKCTRRRTWTTSQRTKSEHRREFLLVLI